jgi:hypothetical protein
VDVQDRGEAVTPAEVLAAAADKLDALVEDASDGPWTAEASSCITRLPGGVAHEFVSWAVFSPEPDEEDPTTMVAGPERDPRDQKLWGGIWKAEDAAYIAAMNPLVGKALADVLRRFGNACERDMSSTHDLWSRPSRVDDRIPGLTAALDLARLIIGGESDG